MEQIFHKIYSQTRPWGELVGSVSDEGGFGERGIHCQMTAAARAINRPKSGVERSDPMARKPLPSHANLTMQPLPTVGKGVGIGSRAITKDRFIAKMGSQMVN